MPHVHVRRYRTEDAPALTALANDFHVARWMTAAFPHPYGPPDAVEWIAKASMEEPLDNFAIDADGTLAGGIGIIPGKGERAGVAELGYWLGRAYWGRGIASEAVRLVTRYAFEHRALRRLEATVFRPNSASARVLEKCGFRREGIAEAGLCERDGTVVDGVCFALVAYDGRRRL